jgi:hypothetical protein
MARVIRLSKDVTNSVVPSLNVSNNDKYAFAPSNISGEISILFFQKPSVMAFACQNIESY